MIQNVEVYSYGICYLSACTALSVEETEKAVNISHPTGIESKWHHADEPFRTGEANPCPCNKFEGRQHMLFVC